MLITLTVSIDYFYITYIDIHTLCYHYIAAFFCNQRSANEDRRCNPRCGGSFQIHHKTTHGAGPAGRRHLQSRRWKYAYGEEDVADHRTDPWAGKVLTVPFMHLAFWGSQVCRISRSFFNTAVDWLLIGIVVDMLLMTQMILYKGILLYTRPRVIDLHEYIHFEYNAGYCTLFSELPSFLHNKKFNILLRLTLFVSYLWGTLVVVWLHINFRYC